MIKIKTEEELKNISRHLYYEIWMLNETAKIDCPDNRIINNCIIEAFGIHARCVCDFLQCYGTKIDDVWAIDFFDNNNQKKEWTQYVTQKINTFEKIRKRVDKELTHLTYVRLEVKLEEKGWDKIKIVQELNQIFKEFLKKIYKERICNELIEFIKKI